MVSFLTMEQIGDLYTFVRKDLSKKYGQRIDIEETYVVQGLIGEDTIKEAIKIVFIPEESNVECIENELIIDLHKYFYNNGLILLRSIVIERDVWLGKVRYKLVYTEGEE